MSELNFDTAFEKLTGYGPFPWQRDLYASWFAHGKFPDACTLPTGLGKTSVIAVWLIALANGKPVPRRLVYVVNRRTVVDQTTDEAVKYRRPLKDNGPPWHPILLDMSDRLRALSSDPTTVPLALSTLRGQFADNREWSADPSRPAIIAGTVDMIGSRLLFSGYGVGFKSKPLHAGFLGQDVLLVHDEAHLEPAFQKLIVAIRDEQKREPAPLGERYRLRVMELTATSRGSGSVFTLSEADRAEDEVKKRINANKAIHLHENKDEKKLPDEMTELALRHDNSGLAVLVFVRTVDGAGKITEKFRKAKKQVETLTGTIRGKERDELVMKPIFQRFLPPSNRDKDVSPAEGTVYLVCTSAGEVGVNISADHLVCDLSTFESMAQRFGRVNRFGACPDTHIDIVHPKEFDKDDKLEDIDRRRKRTLELLKKLGGDGSPRALGEVHRKALREGSGTGPMTTDQTQALRDYILSTYAPQPTILPTSDILFDAWALTTISGKLPGRPMAEPYLHGISDYDPPQTTVAWREEVAELTPTVLAENKLELEEVFDLYPLKPHEELSGPTYGKNKVFEQLEVVAKRDAAREPDKRLSAWVIDPDGSITAYTLQQLVEKDKQNKPLVSLGGRTVVLPPAAGGLQGGMLTGDSTAPAEDVSDRWYADKEQTVKRRVRVWDGEQRLNDVRKVMRLIRRIDLPPPEGDEDAQGRSWHWFTLPSSADDDASKTARDPITWRHHTDDVTDNAKRIADALLKDHADLHAALVMAAKFHDLGKKRVVWQKSIGNPVPTNWHAKSGKDPKTGRLWKPVELTDYRHEFGSLVDLEREPEFRTLPDDQKELVRHLIATHHGRGRPHFPADEAFDPEHGNTEKIAAAVPGRFARLQRKYGRWGLAYLESLLRAADYAASAKPSAFVGDKA